MKKNILAPAVALSLGLAGSLGAIAAPAFADETAQDTPTSKPQQEEPSTDDGNGGTVSPDEEDPSGNDPAVTLSKEALTATEFGNDGVTITIKGEGNTDYSVTVKRDGNLVKGDPVTTDADGNATLKVGGDGETDDSVVGAYAVDVFGTGERVAATEFKVTAEDSNEGDDQQPGEEEEAPAKDPALDLSKKKVVAVDFVNKEKGLNAVVSNLEPGTEVKFNVAGTSGNAKNVRPFKQTVTADKDGNAVFSVAGTSKDNPSAYLGKYTVIAEFDDQKLEGSFEVVSGKGSDAGESEESGSGGGSVSGGASDDVSGSTTSGSSDYLPRTGQGLGGLAAGTALLAVGGATVLLTRRTRKA